MATFEDKPTLTEFGAFSKLYAKVIGKLAGKVNANSKVRMLLAITIRDIAKSRSVAHNRLWVLNNKPDVSKKPEKVLQVIADMGYSPNDGKRPYLRRH